MNDIMRHGVWSRDGERFTFRELHLAPTFIESPTDAELVVFARTELHAFEEADRIVAEGRAKRVQP